MRMKEQSSKKKGAADRQMEEDRTKTSPRQERRVTRPPDTDGNKTEKKVPEEDNIEKKGREKSQTISMRQGAGGWVVNCRKQTQPSPNGWGLISPEKAPGGMERVYREE